MASELVIVKSNTLIEASYRLTINEIRILALTIGVMNPEDTQQIFDFTVSDFVREFPEIKLKNAYKEVQTAVNKLYDRSIRLNDSEKVTDFRWVSSKTYFKKEGRFRIALTNDVMPYLTQLKGQFTRYQLRHIADFNSVYAIRIYELCTQFKSRGYREISLQDLKSWLQVEDKYAAYFDLKKRVIAPAINEINEKSDISVTFEPLRNGRAITDLRFTIKPNPKKAIETTKKQLSNRTKLGRPKLPPRPRVKAGSHEEGEYMRRCEKLIKDFWKGLFVGMEWRDIWEKLPISELKLLHKYYKAFGDDYYYKPLAKLIKKRQETNEKTAL